MTKKEARKIYKEKRMQLSEAELLKLDDLLLIQFQRIPFPALDTVFSYFPMEHTKEPGVHNLLDYCQFLFPALRIAYSKADFEKGEMQAVLVNEETDYAANAYGILEPLSNQIIEPEEIDMILVPLLAFDEKGFRIGYGKGFYDRYLAQCRPDCLKIGLSYFEPIESLIDSNEFDVPLDIVVTPHKLYEY